MYFLVKLATTRHEIAAMLLQPRCEQIRPPERVERRHKYREEGGVGSKT